ncbi:MAG: hypothetical protein ZNDK_1182 [Candidatus Desulfovibrio kirbyi]|uniref:Uncharacterized protein n=1 Tax=Candidatus Desulfovibrio kirbyi TaxID=2696086 RepID=A0A6L2R776_9BACT|nr:MAG: hypothetical protein ZNDK_1182 [Candidatus Desulfovibrio kirbyi]
MKSNTPGIQEPKPRAASNFESSHATYRLCPNPFRLSIPPHLSRHKHDVRLLARELAALGCTILDWTKMAIPPTRADAACGWTRTGTADMMLYYGESIGSGCRCGGWASRRIVHWRQMPLPHVCARAYTSNSTSRASRVNVFHVSCPKMTASAMPRLLSCSFRIFSSTVFWQISL